MFAIKFMDVSRKGISIQIPLRNLFRLASFYLLSQAVVSTAVWESRNVRFTDVSREAVKIQGEIFC